jgi:hypothetical protein
MIDYYKPIIAKLKETLPTYHESFVSSAMQIPCYTVQAYGSRDTRYGDTVGYSQIQYMVKTWAKNASDLEQYALKADTAMRELGFFRASSNELSYDDLLCNLATYEAQGFERYFEEIV